MQDTDSKLSIELSVYESNKSAWMEAHADKFVVIKRKEVLGFFQSFEDAYRHGAEKIGVDADFLVKRIAAREPVFVIY